MNTAAQHVLRVLPDVVLAYGYSDEYSFILHKSCTLFERRSAKIASTVVSTFTSAYVHLWPTFFTSPPGQNSYFGEDLSNREVASPGTEVYGTDQLDLTFLPTFDARCVVYPSDENLRDYISWRQADCHINNLYNTTFWALVLKGGMSNAEAEESLKGTVSSDKNEILWSRFGVNYNNEREIFKKGSVVFREYELVNITQKTRLEPSPNEADREASTGMISVSKTQQEKARKAKQKAKVIVEHIDVIKDEFWLARPWLLAGGVGRPKS